MRSGPTPTSLSELAPVLVLGAGGLLGTEVCRLLTERQMRHVGRTHAECDIGSDAALERALLESEARLVVNCAAYNAVDRAESEPEEAARINAGAPAALARRAPRLVHYSSDFVFDGEKRAPYTEDDAPRPLSAYGRSKAGGDAAVLQAARETGCPHLVLRVGCLYGRAGRNFPSTLLGRLRRGERVRADAERRIQPTWGRLVAEQTLALVEAGAAGLFHAMCRGETTWADFGRELCRLCGLDPGLIEAVPTSALPAPARRPPYAVLENAALDRLPGVRDCMRPWQEALAGYLEDLELEKDTR